MKLLPIDELNVLGNLLRYDMQNMTKQDVVDAVLDILILAYVFGNTDANEMLGTDIRVDDSAMVSAIYKNIDDKTFEDRVTEYFFDGDVESIVRVADTESTRLYNESEMDVAVESGVPCKKQWDATLDDRTRDTHYILDGTIVDLEDYFYSTSGDRALAPGGFETAEENCNCRCRLNFITE